MDVIKYDFKNMTDEEVVDTVADIFEVGDSVEDQLEDGFQWGDVLVLAAQQPRVTEIVNDFPVFMEQFSQLQPGQAKAAVIAARNRALQTRGQIGKITSLLANFLFVAANNYEFAVNTYVNGQNQYLLWNNLIRGQEVFPGPVA